MIADYETALSHFIEFKAFNIYSDKLTLENM